MKTLLITAFAAVFALQVQGQYTFGGQNDYLSDPNDSQSINRNYGEDDLAYLHRLNSMPIIDSISFTDKLYPNQSYCLYFEYNSKGQIAHINKGTNVSSARENIVIVYDGDLIKSINSNLSSSPKVNVIYGYDDAGKLISQKSSTQLGNTEVTIFNPDESIKQVAYYSDMLTTSPSSSTAYYSYDPQGRIKSFVHDLKGLDITGNTKYFGDFNLFFTSTIDKYEYTEPTDSYSFLVQVKNSISKDSIRFTRNNVSIDTCIIDTLLVKNTYKDGILIAQEGFITNNYLQENIYPFNLAYKADSVDGLITKRYTVDQEINKELELLTAKYVYENRNLIQVETNYFSTKIFYAPEPKAKSVQIKGNQVVTVEFNTVLDPATDYAALLTLNNTPLKAETLSIFKAYIATGNAKQLVIELSRPITAGESFEITAAEALPLKDGRTIAFSAVVKAQTVTDVASATAKVIQISQTSAGISITAGAEIASVKVFTASGVLVQSIQPASNEATISTENLPAGVYQVLVTDAEGNSASQTVSF